MALRKFSKISLGKQDSKPRDSGVRQRAVSSPKCNTRLESRVKGTDPAVGKGSYINPKTGRKYYIDQGGKYKRGTELPHVDLHRPSSSSLPKKKLPLGDRLIE